MTCSWIYGGQTTAGSPVTLAAATLSPQHEKAAISMFPAMSKRILCNNRHRVSKPEAAVQENHDGDCRGARSVAESRDPSFRTTTEYPIQDGVRIAIQDSRRPERYRKSLRCLANPIVIFANGVGQEPCKSGVSGISDRPLLNIAPYDRPGEFLAYRFLHSADVHLDSPLRSLALRNPDLANVITLASRRAFEKLVDISLEERVDALILAGDLYDGEQTSMKTARFLAGQIRRLHDAGIRVFIIRGNHDALSKITQELVLPDSVKVFGPDAEAIAIDLSPGHFPVAIHGLSFAKDKAPQSLLRNFLAPVAGAVNVGIMHTSLGGAEGHDHYAPCSVADLHSSGFRYWALGHIHKRGVFEGDATVVMPGIPQGRDINEDGPKSATLVTINDDRSISIEERLTGVAQFERLRVDVSLAEDWRALVETIAEAMAAKRSATLSEHLVARVHLVGTSPLTWNILRDADLLKTDLDERGDIIGNTWIEKLEVQTETAEKGTDGEPADAFAELGHLITGDVLESDAFASEFRIVADELRAQLPNELRQAFGADSAHFDELIDRIKQEGAKKVVAKLLATGA